MTSKPNASMTTILALAACLLAPSSAQSAPTRKHTAGASTKTSLTSRTSTPSKSSSGKASSGKSTASRKRTKAEAKAASDKAASDKAASATLHTVRLNSAFVATEQLRPMAQQLASTRSAASFAGVTSYAQQHPGVQAATANLALGHAYTLDHHPAEAATAFHAAGSAGELADYADYLGAQATLQAGHPADVVPLLDHFADRHPESIFIVNAPLLLANAYIQQRNGAAAVATLQPLLGTPAADRADVRYALARAYQTTGDTTHAAQLYRMIFNTQPLTYEATQSLQQLLAMGMPPTAAERKLRADQIFNARHYSEASNEYSAIRNDPSLTQADRDALEIYMAGCDLKLKHLSRKDAERLPTTTDDSAALKLYLLAEISRTEKDRVQHDAQIAEMIQRFPQSRWLEEALYSGGNMYLLTHDMPQAIYHYQQLVERFPNSIYAPSAHWRDAWMNYRLRKYPEAARLMDEQIVRYGAGVEASSALYWRGRIFEDEERNFAQAANYYRALNQNYPNFYYGELARQRLAVLGPQPQTVAAAPLASVRVLNVPDLAAVVPENDPHLIKAKLLANAALNEYIGPEIAASPTAGQWGALAQAQIYSSFGEYTRALQSIKKSGIPFFSITAQQVPVDYWRLMFPQPYWNDITADAAKNNLDPYLVASLIRQESEFNAGAVSPAKAYGLMQLLASVGKENAKKEGLKGFQPTELMNPSTNIELGTRNLKSVLDRFGGQPEYALAAYNAGDVPVRQWMAQGDYKDIPEFVESIPYSETREYVQAILRNREMYRMLNTSK